MPSQSAKAAAILVFTSGIPGYDTAVRVYDKLATSGEPPDYVLGEFGAARWSPVDTLTDDEWWEEVEMLVYSIDNARAFFEEE